MPIDESISLRAFGYAMRNSAIERQESLSAASQKHGWKPVLDRLRWLQGKHGEQSKYANVIAEDIRFMVIVYDDTLPQKMSQPAWWIRVLPVCYKVLSFTDNLLNATRYGITVM